MIRSTSRHAYLNGICFASDDPCWQHLKIIGIVQKCRYWLGCVRRILLVGRKATLLTVKSKRLAVSQSMSTEQDEKYFESIILRFAIFQNPADLSGKGCMIEFQKRSE